jgi:hypothetical protein
MMTRILAAIVIVTAGTVVAAGAQGLGDAAAREKQKRARTGDKAPGQVVTDKDLQKYAGDRPAPTAPSADTREDDARDKPAAGGAPAVAATGVAGSDADKRRLAAEYKEKLAAAQDAVAKADAELADAEAHWQFVNSHTNDSFPLAEARGRLDVAKQQARRAHDVEGQLLDGARRAGIPPGWLR